MSSVVEQLGEAHLTARRAKYGHPRDARALVRTWPITATAAHRLMTAMPASDALHDTVVERIALDARSISVSADPLVWPGAGRSDPVLADLATRFDKAAGSRKLTTMTPEDATQARLLVLQTLWLMSRMVGESARDVNYDLRFSPQTSWESHHAWGEVSSATAKRFNAVEQLAAGGLHLPIGAPNTPAGALRQAVATWDVEAHRALLGDRSTGVLHVVAHQQAQSVHAFKQFVDGAAKLGVIDFVTHQRLAPVLTDSAEAWTALQGVAAEFWQARTPVPQSLFVAAVDLRTQFEQFAHVPDPGDARGILGTISDHLASSVTVAATARDLLRDEAISGPARAIARVVSEHFPLQTETVVPAEAIRKGRIVTLPSQARHLLEDPADRCLSSADEAFSRTAGLDALRRTSPADSRPATPTTRTQGPPPRSAAGEHPPSVRR
ncbi:hypothetical protein GCM10022234_22430 [Aeromicrobium panaciterrae]|uniref:hypothetical protein n=1 Tax=Aeromicrobium panaciterrae TaxID=363861 RepID=UPI0031E34618